MKKKNGFIILNDLMGGYQPTFHEDGLLMFFDTDNEAQIAIDECIADTVQAFERGDMYEAYTQEDYRIVPATLTGDIIECTVEGVEYAMYRHEDDYTPKEEFYYAKTTILNLKKTDNEGNY